LPVWRASVLQYPSWRVLARESSDCRGTQHCEALKLLRSSVDVGGVKDVIVTGLSA
jgi:hypothetical protein